MATWSGMWNGMYNRTYAPLAGGNTVDYNKTKWVQLAKLTRGPAGRKMGIIIRTLTGQAPGAAMSMGITRVPASPAPGAAYSGGGKITATVKTEINRNTNAADETWIDSATTLKSWVAYPKDKSGAGGAKPPGFF